jgi:hypothetical protein
MRYTLVLALLLTLSPPSQADPKLEAAPPVPGASRFVPAPVGDALPLQPLPWSHDPRTRERQVVARQLAVLDWTRWQADAWPLVGPEELWLFGPPASFAWRFPPVEQPVGYQRVYDGRGGYSSGPVYAYELAAPAWPVPVPAVPAPPVLGRSPGHYRALPGSSAPPTQNVNGAAARVGAAPRQLFSW